MAKAIQLDISVRDPQAEFQQRLTDASQTHAAALVELLELAQTLHDRGVLTALRGAVGAGGSLIDSLAEAAAQPESIRGMRNIMVLAKIFGSIDPVLLEMVQRTAPAVLKQNASQTSSRSPSLWSIAKVFWSPEVRRTLMALGLILAGVGMYLNKEEHRNAE